MVNLSKNNKNIAMSEVYFGRSPASILASWLLVFVVVVVFSSRSRFSEKRLQEIPLVICPEASHGIASDHVNGRLWKGTAKRANSVIIVSGIKEADMI